MPPAILLPFCRPPSDYEIQSISNNSRQKLNLRALPRDTDAPDGIAIGTNWDHFPGSNWDQMGGASVQVAGSGNVARCCRDPFVISNAEFQETAARGME